MDRSSLTIGRTSSQDSGVDMDSDVIVATASVEVGFDDAKAGAVLQHKAPRQASSFVQRKGRAGRTRGMRPWTVVVLSDYGRDQAAFLQYENLFSPRLEAADLARPPAHLMLPIATCSTRRQFPNASHPTLASPVSCHRAGRGTLATG